MPPLSSPSARSETNMPTSGTIKAQERLAKYAPPNRATASTGEKLGGCGISRLSAAMKIKPASASGPGLSREAGLVDMRAIHGGTTDKAVRIPQSVDSSFDILILGAGLVGSSLACALESRGLRVGLVEASAPAAGSPGFDERKLALSAASLNALTALGVLTKMSSPPTSIRRIHV